ncbi:TPA: hypothetical protein HA231_03390 [Candidatus Woesearchaeota archaeon]|nr:hypothetical protein [Candidatus Woesearchaeota archaeon]
MESEEESLSGMEERLSEVRKRVMTLEWDKSHSQLNSGMEQKYGQLKAEQEELQKKVGTIKADMKEKDAA